MSTGCRNCSWLNYLLQSHWYNRIWCQRNRSSSMEFYTSTSKELKLPSLFSVEFFSCHLQWVTVGAPQCSSAQAAQHLWLQEEENRERSCECRIGTEMFSSWMFKADVLHLEMRNSSRRSILQAACCEISRNCTEMSKTMHKEMVSGLSVEERRVFLFKSLSISESKED